MSVLDAAILGAAMVIGLVSGLYAGLGLNAGTPLDRNAELWLALAMWTVALAGAFSSGNLAIGLVLGGLVLLMAWSVLHFPQVRTLETPVPRRVPLYTFFICLVMAILLGVAIALSDIT